MDQKGYTAFGYVDMTFDEKMKYFMNNRVKFLIIDSILTKEEYLQPYIKSKLGNYQNICIFNLQQAINLQVKL